MMGVTEAAGLIGYSPRRTRELLEEGLLGGIKFGNKWVVSCQAVERFMLIDPRYDGPPYVVRRIENEDHRMRYRTRHGFWVRRH